MTDVFLLDDETVSPYDVVLGDTTVPLIAGRLNHLLRIRNGVALRYGAARVFDRGGADGCVRAGGNAHGIFASDGTGNTWRLDHTQDSNGINPAQKWKGGRLVGFQAIKLRSRSS